jgi:hypothetical protein
MFTMLNRQSLFLAMAIGSCAVAFAADQPPIRNGTESVQSRPAKQVWMAPPSYDKGRCFRELFEQPDAWRETRAAIDVVAYADLNINKQFSDDQLRAWFSKLQPWGIKFALEVGALKPWGTTGEKTFAIERPMWDRIERLGGSIYAIAMDEPLCAARKEIHKPDDYAVEETARYIALVRWHYPRVLIGDIEPYPYLPLPDLMRWIDALEKRLAQMHVKGLDFFRLDVDWVCFTVGRPGSWPEVKRLEQYCRGRKLAFSLIYWASGYPALERRGMADDSTWYVSTMQQGYDYAAVDGAPDQYVIESWIDAPSRCLPETGEFTFTRSVRDFSRKFARRGPVPDKYGRGSPKGLANPH